MGRQSLARDRKSAVITWSNHSQPQASAYKKMADKVELKRNNWPFKFKMCSGDIEGIMQGLQHSDEKFWCWITNIMSTW